MEEMAVYEQLTISDWLEMKERLRRELQSVTESFVRIGYALRKIDDQKMYEADGYKSVAEFAKAEYGLEPSTVSRFMSINREYSIDGYSERLRPEYIGMGQSKLSEMLQLPEADRALITPDTQREDIRELKRFNKEEPARGEADDLTDLIEAYFKANREDLNELYSMEEKDPRAAADLLNPSGSKTFRKGLYMMFFYEESVKIKKFGENPVTYTWLDFLKKVDEIFGPAAAGNQTWERYFGEEEIAPAQKSGGKEDGCTAAAETTEGKTAGTAGEKREESETGRSGEDQGGDHRDRSGHQEVGTGGELGTNLPTGSGNTEETGPREEKGDRETGGSNEKAEKSDGQESSSYSADRGDEPCTEEEGTEEIAPAQKEEPVAADPEEPVQTRYREGEYVFMRGKIDMISVTGEIATYRLRTESGKTIWCAETDIAKEAVEIDE